jgi:hypothetical protein
MAVIKMQELKLNRLYQSEDNRSDDFALEKNEHLSDKDENNDEKKQEDFDSSSSSKTKRILSKSTFMESNEYDTQIMSKERRSYSNSKLDYHKWQRALTRRPAYNRIDQWSSHVLSEYELKKFLKKANIDQNHHNHHHQESSNDKIMTTSLNPIMVSSMNTQYWSNSNQTQRNHKCKSYSGSLHQQHHHHQQQQQQRNKKMTTTKLNKELKSCNLFSSYSASNNSGLKYETRASTFKALDGDDGSGSDMVIKRNSALVRFGHKLRNHLSSERMLFNGSGKIG